MSAQNGTALDRSASAPAGADAAAPGAVRRHQSREATSLTRRPPRERLAGTLAAIAWGVEHGAAILRVHDVREVADFLAVRAALRGDLDVAPDLALTEEIRLER